MNFVFKFRQLVFQKPGLLFKKQLLEAITQVELTFLWKFTHVFSFEISAIACRNFIFLPSEDITQKVKRPGFYVLQEDRFHNFSLKLQNRKKDIFVDIPRRTHVQNFWEK